MAAIIVFAFENRWIGHKPRRTTWHAIFPCQKQDPTQEQLIRLITFSVAFRCLRSCQETRREIIHQDLASQKEGKLGPTGIIIGRDHPCRLYLSEGGMLSIMGDFA